MNTVEISFIITLYIFLGRSRGSKIDITPEELHPSFGLGSAIPFQLADKLRQKEPLAKLWITPQVAKKISAVAVACS